VRSLSRPALELLFLGHNSWHIRSGCNGLLIDPLLLPSFGNSAVRPFKVHPSAPAIGAEQLAVRHVLLTHEHSDHVDLQSLALLPGGTKVYVGPVFPQYLEAAIGRLGHVVVRCDYRSRFEVEGVSVCLYPCDPATAFWEQRVSQPLLSLYADFSDAIFMAVDALISIEYLTEIEMGVIDQPRVVAISNNSYFMPPGEHGPLDSVSGNQVPGGIAGLDLLSELTRLPPPLSKTRPTIVVAGGGIRRFDEHLHWPFSDQQEMARLCAVLAPNLEYIAPRQGDSLIIGPSSECSLRTSTVHQETVRTPARPPSFSQVVPTSSTSRTDEQCFELIESELDRLAAAVSMSPIGDLWWKSVDASEYVAVIVLLSSAATIHTILGLRGPDPKFRMIHGDSLDDVVKLAPHGLVCFYQDIASVIAGEIEIWDIVGKAVKCWHPQASSLDNLTSFLYCYFGEQVRPDLAHSALLSTET